MSPKKDVEILTPSIVTMTSLENRMFADDQIKMESLGWAQTNMTGVLIRRRNLDTETGMCPGEMIGRHKLNVIYKPGSTWGF